MGIKIAIEKGFWKFKHSQSYGEIENRNVNNPACKTILVRSRLNLVNLLLLSQKEVVGGEIILQKKDVVEID